MIGVVDTDGAGSSATTGLGVPSPAELAALLPSLQAELEPRYRIQGFLGRGAYATVWQALDTVTEETVAIKRCDRRLDDARPFYRELSALFRLRHERIVRVINLLELPDGTRCLVLEYCAGGSLRRALRRADRLQQPCPTERVRVLALQVAEGLAAAHRLGLVHRDLKPENLLFQRATEHPWDDAAVLKIVDFGLARALRILAPDEGQTLGGLSGSPAYMAPEQFDSTFAPASDLYALGTILYELLHGQPPFRGTPDQLAFQHLRTTPTIDPTLPWPWPTLLASLLQKDPTQRPTAAALIDLLGQRQTDRRTHPCRQAGRFLRLPRPATTLLALEQPAPTGCLVVADGHGLQRLHGTTGTPLGQLAVPGLHQVVADAASTLWVSTAGRLLRVPAAGPVTVVRKLTRPLDALAAGPLPDGRERLALLCDDDLAEYELPRTDQPLWRVALRARGWAPLLARLPAGNLAVAEGPLQPSLSLYDLAGQRQTCLPLPGLCWQLTSWPGTAGLFALLVVGQTLQGCWIEPHQGRVALLPGGTDLAFLTAAPDRSGLVGLHSSGAVSRWPAPARHQELPALAGGTAVVGGLAADARQVAFLCRSRDACWIQLVEALPAEERGDDGPPHS